MKNNAEEMVTKKEFSGEMAEIRRIMASKVELDKAMNWFKETFRWFKADFDRSFAELKETMATKADIAKLMSMMDEMVTEVRASRQERLLREPQLLRIDDHIFDHEKRIRVLEKR